VGLKQDQYLIHHAYCSYTLAPHLQAESFASSCYGGTGLYYSGDTQPPTNIELSRDCVRV
jgi:hypothetical protein